MDIITGVIVGLILLAIGGVGKWIGRNRQEWRRRWVERGCGPGGHGKMKDPDDGPPQLTFD